MDQLLLKLAGGGAVIAVLVYFILYFKSELASKNAEIKELNTILRNTQKETINAMNAMTDAVQHLTELIKSKL